MGADIKAYIQIDDNTPPDVAPFTNDPSTWDLTRDIGLCGCKDYRFFGAVSGVRNDSGIDPLYSLRGLPPTSNRFDPIFALQDDLDDSNVGWLTLREIHLALDHMSIEYASLSKHVLRVLETIATLERLVGPDRVRLVFSIHD